MRIRDRIRIWREVVWAPWKAVVVALYGLVCTLEFARDHWASPSLKDTLHFVPNLTWYGWLIGALVLILVLTLESAYRAISSRENQLIEIAAEQARVELVAEQDRVGARPEEWGIEFHGEVAEIKVLADSLSRCAVALDVVITNRSTRAISLSARLQAQWAHPMVFRVAHQHEIAIPEWHAILIAFDLPNKHQLLLPMDLAHGSKSGHVVFDIPIDGMGVSSAIGSAMGGIREEDETEREREYRLVFVDAITNEEKVFSVSSLSAPKLDRLGVANRTDLAMAGNAETFTVTRQTEEGDFMTALAAVAPRRLSDQQRAIVAKHLAPLIAKEHGASSIHVLAGEGPDCGDYARQFAEVFTSMGIRSDRHSPPAQRGDDFYYGLTVRWDRKRRDKYGFPHDGPVFAEALRAAGIEVSLIEREGSFTSLIVGSRR